MEQDSPQISNWRLAFLVLIAVTPLVTLMSYATDALTASWPVCARSILIAPIMVGAIVFGIIPAIHVRFGQFIRPDTSRTFSRKRTQS